MFVIIVRFSYICVSQSRAKTHLRYGGIYNNHVTVRRMWQWKKFENRSIIGENMDKNKVPRFYGPQCIARQQLNTWPAKTCWEQAFILPIVCNRYNTLCLKNIPDIFDCNLKINYQIFDNFWCEYFWHNLLSNDYSVSHLNQHLFLHYLVKTQLR